MSGKSSYAELLEKLDAMKPKFEEKGFKL